MYTDFELSAPAVRNQPVDINSAFTLTTTDLPSITKYLNTLLPAEIVKVGTELGLDYAHLKRMKQESLIEEMVHAWLRRDDSVGETTWHSLIRALESAGHNGIASSIRKGIWLLIYSYIHGHNMSTETSATPIYNSVTVSMIVHTNS